MLLGVENFRDFGGYAAGPGQCVRDGVLYRSATLSSATPADLVQVATLNIATIVDLRRRGEREAHPYPGGRWTEGRTIITSDFGGDDDPWLAFLREGDVSLAAVHAYIEAFYTSIPLDPRHIDLFKRYLDALATAPGAVLIHCAAGKDRTGVLVALTQTLLGVHRDDIHANFLLTNRARRYEDLRDVVAEIITRESGGKVPGEDILRLAVGVDVRFLDAALAAILAQWGTMDRYFRDAVGISDSQRDAILDRLIVAA